MSDNQKTVLKLKLGPKIEGGQLAMKINQIVSDSRDAIALNISDHQQTVNINANELHHSSIGHNPVLENPNSPQCVPDVQCQTVQPSSVILPPVSPMTQSYDETSLIQSFKRSGSSMFIDSLDKEVWYNIFKL